MTAMTGPSRRRRLNAWVGGLLVVLNLLALNYLGAGHYLRMDLTEESIHTLNPDTVRILQRMDDLITVKYFITRDLPPGYQEVPEAVKDLLEEFKVASGGKLQIVFVDPADDPDLRTEAEQYGIPEQYLRVLTSDSHEEKLVFLGMVLLYEDRFAAIPVANPITLEYDLLMQIVRLLRTEEISIGFYQRSNLSADLPAELNALKSGGRGKGGRHTLNGDYRYIHELLRKQYPVEIVTLAEPVPDRVKTLVVANTASLNELTCYHIDQFLMRGGRLALLVPGVKVDMASLEGAPRKEELDPWLEHYGIEVDKNVIMDVQSSMVQMSSDYGGVRRVRLPPCIHITQAEIDPESPLTRGFRDLLFPFCSSIRLNPTEGAFSRVLVRSSKQAWAESEKFNLQPDSIKMPGEGALRSFDLAGIMEGEFLSYFAGRPAPASLLSAREAGDGLSVTHPPGMLLRSPRTSIFVAGTSDFIGSCPYVVQDRNVYIQTLQFFCNVVDYLTLGEGFDRIRSRESRVRFIDQEVKDDPRLKNYLKVAGTLTGALFISLLGILLYAARRTARNKEVILE